MLSAPDALLGATEIHGDEAATPATKRRWSLRALGAAPLLGSAIFAVFLVTALFAPVLAPTTRTTSTSTV